MQVDVVGVRCRTSIGILLLQNINRSTTNDDASACFMGNKAARLFNNIRVGSFVRRECMGKQYRSKGGAWWCMSRSSPHGYWITAS